MAARASGVNQMTLDRPRTDTIAAARRGPRAAPAFPPTWKTDWAKAAAFPGRHIGDARRLGVEYRRAQADETHRDEEDAEALREREYDEPDEGEDHPEGQGVGLRLAVRDRAHHRLQERGGQLVREGYQTDLREVQVEAGLDEGVDGRDERLHRVVQQVRNADRDQNGEDGRFGAAQNLLSRR